MEIWGPTRVMQWIILSFDSRKSFEGRGDTLQYVAMY